MDKWILVLRIKTLKKYVASVFSDR